MSQTLGVGLLEHIYTAILDALEDETHGIHDAGCARRVDIHVTLQEIKALQTKLDATDDEDEQRALEEDVTGMILWFSWCGILSEVVNYIRRERDSKTPDSGDRFRQGLREIADIIKKTTPYDDHDDDLGHLKRIMFDASTGVSKQRLWLAARAAEKAKWLSNPAALRTCDQSKQPEMTSSD
ncbi:hypothetical protein M404DRAFT_33081 [Pisolithus tinctorius Marx 270]|uniref:Uncharacterized protein n=1 Tax=Pisolithus tinctorius Marx 270 TaxID=870435 RepID=A0A0C3IHU3_PISTI|nr:hypothetical protein M404DRAFT_33081 [Pisolithus tinctorius Marx 270]